MIIPYVLDDSITFHVTFIELDEMAVAETEDGAASGAMNQITKPEF